MMHPMTTVRRLPQDTIPIWGGPAHGQVSTPTKDVAIRVAVQRPISYALTDEDTMIPAFEIAEYQTAKFVWRWRDEWWSARMFLPMNPAYDTPATIEVESVLRFLATLWGWTEP